MFSSNNSSSEAAFIPTGAVRLIHSLKKTFPSHRLILADFDHLPSPEVHLFGGSSRGLRDEQLWMHTMHRWLLVWMRKEKTWTTKRIYLHVKSERPIYSLRLILMLREAYFQITGRPSRVFRSSSFLWITQMWSEHALRRFTIHFGRFQQHTIFIELTLLRLFKY